MRLGSRRTPWNRAPLAIALVLAVGLTLLAPSLQAEPLRDSALGSALHVTAIFLYFTTGGSCSTGTEFLVAHFTENVTGGAPPYQSLWQFGDGSNASTLSQPTHAFSDSRWPWNVTLTVTDSLGATGSSYTWVYPTVPSCGIPHSGGLLDNFPWIDVVLVAVLAVPVALVLVVWLWRPRRRRPPETVAALGPDPGAEPPP